MPDAVALPTRNTLRPSVARRTAGPRPNWERPPFGRTAPAARMVRPPAPKVASLCSRGFAAASHGLCDSMRSRRQTGWRTSRRCSKECGRVAAHGFR